MGKEIPPLASDPSFDPTQPDLDAMDRKTGFIQEFMDAVYGIDANPDGEPPLPSSGKSKYFLLVQWERQEFGHNLPENDSPPCRC